MSKNYTQLSFEQRYQIEALLQTGRSQKEIAQQIGVHPSTICREFRRNSARRGPTAGCYSARNGQRKTAECHAHNTKALKFNDCMIQVAFARLATNASINGFGRLSMVTSARINPLRDCTKTSAMGIEGVKEASGGILGVLSRVEFL
jgi:IS30 family transposase